MEMTNYFELIMINFNFSHLLPFLNWVSTPSKRHTALAEVRDPPRNS